MQCGRIALEKLGVTPTKYYASEIDRPAMRIAQLNYPDSVQLGDIRKWKEWGIPWHLIDLVIGGSPCQGFSFAGKQKGFKDPRSKLFFTYCEILANVNHERQRHGKVQPVKFLLENVKMKPADLDVISLCLGVRPVAINSNRESIQNRVRYYWANWKITQPESKTLKLSDVMELYPADYPQEKVRVVNQAKRVGGLTENERGFRAHIGDARKGAVRSIGRVYKHSAPYIDTLTCKWVPKLALNSDIENLVCRDFLPEECEIAQTVPAGYTEGVSKTERHRMLGNGWTVDVIAHAFYCNELIRNLMR